MPAANTVIRLSNNSNDNNDIIIIVVIIIMFMTIDISNNYVLRL